MLFILKILQVIFLLLFLLILNIIRPRLSGGASLYPFCNTFITDQEVWYTFQLLQRARIKLITGNYNVANIILTDNDKQFLGKRMFIKVDDNNYWKSGFLSDYFNESVRIKCKRYDEQYSPYEYWEKHGDAFSSKESGKEVIKHINQQLSEKVMGCNTFRIALMIMLIKYFKSTSVLDFSAGWGDRLIAAIATHVEYLGIDPNFELYNGYKKILQFFTKKEVQGTGTTESPLICQNYKMICSPYQNLDEYIIGQYTYDLIFTCPPYFDLEKYSDAETQSINEFSTQALWETNFLYKSLSKAWSRLQPYGHMIIIINNVKHKPDFTLKMARWVSDNLTNAEYLGLLPFMVTESQKSAQPVWIWRKRDSTPLNELYYIGNLKCELGTFETIESFTKYSKLNLDKIEEDVLYMSNVKQSEKSNRYLNYGVIDIIGKKYKIKYEFTPIDPLIPLTTSILGKYTIINENLLSLGTRQRGLGFLINNNKKLATSCTWNVWTQALLAYECFIKNIQLDLFSEKANHQSSLFAQQYGANIHTFPDTSPFYIENECKQFLYNRKDYKRIDMYAESENYKKLIIDRFNKLSFDVSKKHRIWCIANSLTLISILQQVFQNATFLIARTEKDIWMDDLDVSRTIIYDLYENNNEPAIDLPPYPCSIYSDAKVWQFIEKNGQEGDLIWLLDPTKSFEFF